jgi:IS605 OrfB family transposase
VLVTITNKVKILANKEQSEQLLQTMQTYSDACNCVSAHIFETRNFNQVDVHKALYYDLRQCFPLNAQMTQSVMRTVIARYKTIRTNEKSWIKPNFKHPECDLLWNRDYSLLKTGILSLSTTSGRIKVKYDNTGMSHFFDGTWAFGTAKLVTKHGKWFLHISVSKEFEQLAESDVCNVVGVDLGVNFLATSYDSKGKTLFFNGRPVKQKRAKYKRTRRSLQRRQTPSARQRLKQIGQRENRWMHDVNHQVSKALLDSQPEKTLFVLEDLTGIRNATERVRLRNRCVLVSWAFFDLRTKIEYKAKMRNSLTIALNPRYTSQMCPKCGHTARNNRNKKLHIFCCKNCGYTSNDDRVAAMNQHRKGIEYLTNSLDRVTS